MTDKERARYLVGKQVQFAHEAEDVPSRLVTSANTEGMVEVEGMVGLFAASVFNVVEQPTEDKPDWPETKPDFFLENSQVEVWINFDPTIADLPGDLDPHLALRDDSYEMVMILMSEVPQFRDWLIQQTADTDFLSENTPRGPTIVRALACLSSMVTGGEFHTDESESLLIAARAAVVHLEADVAQLQGEAKQKNEAFRKIALDTPCEDFDPECINCIAYRELKEST